MVIWKIAKLLIDHGANLNLQAANGNTALLFASYRGYTEIAKQLLTMGQNWIYKVMKKGPR